ncbi:bifunctional diaminohydroxyphosphoribosylaminopyrimidine deaminase/5-amino-6-(5-phosphoribosylamino)uracil reductase RibD [Kaistia dalseonensis]|uniref:Riboflavin biosynthesis protein RibD n=1 Tax=Kaistia dalseonensis TaxID=410840 RepID=A0ABU0H2R5_9HYPH|nr:bifunctional diaminohydroxyphosphoribosylaminopyrimidine deaminase/5-amino-6-(5-phosphoribosylamino)uracil reductase RibD [Kaistia dalseonensis]MCX5493622.1 bifunctional diaminohydroxyphosphoribosylaminopyrimidine deaminase/5-amino-6-(5-phosphoribosylamino)uracil reductase RibD [Kaistia dalseonensis]MDQ0436183.1 diaminohydroxyphosphoribosylaminopyrimidine deaminase/5-amino-6-(5-phosphoribosylamino)uracil reductase [Kaistia dalseonensis]
MAAAETTIADPETDRRLMAAALRLGRRHLGSTFPAPAVGVLIVRFDTGVPVIVGRGATPPGASGHAIAIALDEAGEAARGATVYTSIEPTIRHEDGASDTDRLVAAGIQRVVSAMDDPDPQRGGAGHARLRDAGLQVSSGILGEEARRVHAGFIARMQAGRPHVTLKLAVSADGMIGRSSGERVLVSGKEAFARLQAMRIETDATLIGIGTALAADPSLIVRVPGLKSLSPIRVVLDTQLRLSPQSALVQGAGEIPLWVIAGPEAPEAARSALVAAGAEIISAPLGSGGVDLPAALRTLAERGITRLLVEGGARVAASLVGQGLADEVVLFRAPVVVGPDGVRALAGRALSAIERSPRYRIIEEAMLGDDRMVRYERTS